MTAKSKDFFISYNSQDKAWAEWIAWHLEEAGYSTVIQAWDFRPGDNFVLKMQDAATQASRTVAVLSSNYLAAQFTQPEWAAAFAQDPTGAKGTLLPVRVAECHPPGLLATTVSIDLVGLEEAAAKDTLLAGIRRDRLKPSSPPPFQGQAGRQSPPFPALPVIRIRNQIHQLLKSPAAKPLHDEIIEQTEVGLMANRSQNIPIIIVLEDAHVRRLELEPDGAELLLRSDIAVLAYPSEERTKLIEILEQHGLWRPGIRAVQSPYTPTRYASVENACHVFALEKHFVLTSLCAHLGATAVSVEQIQIKSSRGTDTLDLTGKHPGGIAASAKYNSGLVANLKSEQRLDDRYDGGEPDLGRARQLLREKRLAGDPGLWSLIESRSAVNRLKERTLEISLTNDSQQTIEIAATLSIPTYGTFGTGWTAESIERVEYRLNYRIKF